MVIRDTRGETRRFWLEGFTCIFIYSPYAGVQSVGIFCPLNHLELHVDAEEAYSRIVPHAMHATTTGTKRIIVLSTDTDVAVILLFYWQRLKVHGLTEHWVNSRLVSETQLGLLHFMNWQLLYHVIFVKFYQLFIV